MFSLPLPQPTRAALLSLSLAFAATSSVLSFAPEVQAQSVSEKAAAEALYDDGVRLFKQGEYEKARKKLEKSQSVDPGIGTLLYLGECYKELGRTASAWATFREAASKADAAGEETRAQAGMSRANALESKLSRLTLEVSEENEQIEGLEIVQGQVKINRALWGTDVPVDPGELVVQARAPGYETFEVKITIKKGPSEASIEIPALVALPESEQTAEAAPAAATAATPEDRGPQVGDAQRTWGLVLGGVGIGGIAAGSVFGVLAINKDKKADEACGGSDVCPVGSGGGDLSKDARTFATVSTVGFAVGGALLVGGAVLYFTAPKEKKSTSLSLTPTLGGAQLSLGGAF